MTTTPEQPVYPPDLDLDAMTQRDQVALPMLESIVNDIRDRAGQPDEHVLILLRAVQDRHELLTELHTARRDRDSARNTVLMVATQITRWRRKHTGPAHLGDQFSKGMSAACETLADILARQMIRD